MGYRAVLLGCLVHQALCARIVAQRCLVKSAGGNPLVMPHAPMIKHPWQPRFKHPTAHMLCFLQMVAESRSNEAFVALCLLTVGGSSLLTKQLGLSDTLGAFIAGVLLAETSFRTQVTVVDVTRRFGNPHMCTLL